MIAFQQALWYDPGQKLVLTEGSKEHCAAACERWPQLGAAVPDAKAEERALGLMSPFGEEVVDMPPVEMVDTVVVPRYLTENMIPGAKLDPQPWPRGYPTY